MTRLDEKASVPGRTEEIRFRMAFDARKARAHRCALSILAPHLIHDLADDDVLRFSYTVHVAYFDEVHRKLDAMIEVLDDEEMVLGGDIEEMSHGRSIINEVLTKLDRLIAMEADR